MEAQYLVRPQLPIKNLPDRQWPYLSANNPLFKIYFLRNVYLVEQMGPQVCINHPAATAARVTD